MKHSKRSSLSILLIAVLALCGISPALAATFDGMPVPDDPIYFNDTLGKTVDDIQLTYLPDPDFDNPDYFAYPENITAIGEIFEDGLTMVAVRIEYSDAIEAGQILPVKFSIPGRTIIRGYVNETGTRDQIAQSGHYAFLELLVNEEPDCNEFKETSGVYSYTPVGGTASAIDLPMVTTVRQIQTIFTTSGKRIAPFNRASDDQHIEIVDEFITDSYADPETGIRIKYNLFVPEGYEAKADSLEDLPLVLFLHGGGETGYDNRGQVVCYRQVEEYILPEAQAENPCFVMMPQAPMTYEKGVLASDVDHGWYTNIKGEDGVKYTYPSKAMTATINAMLEMAGRYNVDANRIYVCGHSMGGGGATSALIARPDVFAAACSFAAVTHYTDEELAKIVDKPVFFTVSEDERAEIAGNMLTTADQLEALGVNLYRAMGDDAWDGLLRDEAAQAQAEETIAKAEAAGATMIFAHFMRGSVVNVPHHSHRASFENAGIRHWLFSQTLNG